MYRLKITQPGFEGYTGALGPVDFDNGISVEPVPVIMADRLAATMMIVTVDDEGNEVSQAGVAARMVGGVTIRADVVEALGKASEDDLIEDRRRLAESQARPPVSKLYTVAELKAVADEKGINGLREIAKPWGVKERSIPKLIQEILVAQDEFQKRVKAAEAKAEVDEGKLAEDTKPIEFAYIDPATGGELTVTAPPPAPTQAPDVEQDVEQEVAPEGEDQKSGDDKPDSETPDDEKPAEEPEEKQGAADDKETGETDSQDQSDSQSED